jgi:multicomponent Na+:H+ antiporter subunit D
MYGMFIMACLFTVAGTIYAHHGTRTIHEFRGLNKKLPVTMVLFMVSVLSVVGLPPLPGFFSKWYIMLGVIQAQQWPFLTALLMSSLLNVILFFRILEQIYFSPREHNTTPHEDPEIPIHIDPVPLTELVPIVCLSCCIILLGLFSNSVITRIISWAVPAAF